jgi:hypothetical protein
MMQTAESAVREFAISSDESGLSRPSAAATIRAALFSLERIRSASSKVISPGDVQEIFGRAFRGKPRVVAQLPQPAGSRV